MLSTGCPQEMLMCDDDLDDVKDFVSRRSSEEIFNMLNAALDAETMVDSNTNVRLTMEKFLIDIQGAN